MIRTGRRLEGKTALITGGAGGIGAAVARRFMEEGASVMIADSDARSLRSALSSLRLGAAGHAGGAGTDILSWRAVIRLVRRTVSLYGGLDILVNAAAVQKPIGDLLSVRPGEWDACLRTNVTGTMHCCKAALPEMLRKGKGKIINFSGGGATYPRPGFSAYGASKAAVVRFTEILAAEFKDRGVDVNAVSPGAVYTRMTREIIRAGKAAGDDYREAVKMGPGANTPARTADLCVFLASRASDGITGRLLSAAWDDWRALGGGRKALAASSLYTLRRIDGSAYFEKRRKS